MQIAYFLYDIFVLLSYIIIIITKIFVPKMTVHKRKFLI